MKLLIFDIRYGKVYAGWQKVAVENIGTFRVPDEWIVTEEGRFLYFTDSPTNEEGRKIYLIGRIWRGLSKERDEVQPVFIHDLFEAELVRSVHANGTQRFSNGADYGRSEYRIGEDTFEKQGVFLGRGITLVAWDDLVEQDIMIMIAKSFRSTDWLKCK